MIMEYTLVFTVALFILSYVFDFLAGTVKLVVKNPITFLSSSYIRQYPLTVLEIGLRSLGLVLTVILVLSIMERRYFTKAGISLFVAIVAVFYAIQQMATSGTLTPIQWTLAFAYSGMALILIAGVYIILGIFSGVHASLTKKGYEPKEKDEKPSILDGKHVKIDDTEEE